MKVTSIVYAALLAVASVEAAATTPSSEGPAITPSSEDVCNLPGHPCDKMKRAAAAVAEAVAEPEAYRTHFCYRRGEACAKAKRDALALAEAVADAHASANPEPAAEPGKPSQDHLTEYRKLTAIYRGLRDPLLLPPR